MITKADKEKQVQELSDSLKKAKAAFLVGFQGINVEQVTQMRKDLQKNAGEMKVFRNTLLKQALVKEPEILKHLTPTLTGANAFVFAMDDPCSVAKTITNYVKQTEILKIKTGVLEGKGISALDVKTLGALPSINVLKAQLLAVFSAPLRRVLYVLSAAPIGFLRVIQMVQKQKQEMKDGG